MQKPQYELNDPPSDGISSVKFSFTNPSLLLVSSWDKVIFKILYMLIHLFIIIFNIFILLVIFNFNVYY